MSLTHDATGRASRVASRTAATAARAADRSPLAGLARAGFVGYGVVHLLVAWLAVQIALGAPAGSGDQAGALARLAGEPLGVFLVAAIGVGLAAMALWQALEAAAGHRGDRGTERTLERIGSAGRALVYAYLAWTAVAVLTQAKSSSAGQQESTTARLMASTGGRWLVALAGVAVVAVGVGLIVFGVIRRFEKHLETSRMSAGTRKASRLLGGIGYPAKGTAYGIVGVLLVTAAVSYDSDKARGLDGALRTLAHQPHGRPLLLLVAAGIAGFAGFCFVQARYRKV